MNKTRGYLQNYKPGSLGHLLKRDERMIAESLTACYLSTVATATVTLSGMRKSLAHVEHVIEWQHGIFCIDSFAVNSELVLVFMNESNVYTERHFFFKPIKQFSSWFLVLVQLNLSYLDNTELKISKTTFFKYFNVLSQTRNHSTQRCNISKNFTTTSYYPNLCFISAGQTVKPGETMPRKTVLQKLEDFLSLSRHSLKLFHKVYATCAAISELSARVRDNPKWQVISFRLLLHIYYLV